MKVLLNKWDNPKISECIWVGKGDKVFATNGASEWGFTECKEYEIEDIWYGDLVMKNDNDEKDVYSVEYFTNYKRC